MKRKLGNVESESLSVSSHPFHFLSFLHYLSISSSFSHSLSIFSQPGCQAATICATLCLVLIVFFFPVHSSYQRIKPSETLRTLYSLECPALLLERKGVGSLSLLFRSVVPVKL